VQGVTTEILIVISALLNLHATLTRLRPVQTKTVTVTAIRVILSVVMGQLQTAMTAIQTPIRAHLNYVTTKLITTVTVKLIVPILPALRIRFAWPIHV
jgi:hypothetical protein